MLLWKHVLLFIPTVYYFILTIYYFYSDQKFNLILRHKYVQFSWKIKIIILPGVEFWVGPGVGVRVGWFRNPIPTTIFY